MSFWTRRAPPVVVVLCLAALTVIPSIEARAQPAWPTLYLTDPIGGFHKPVQIASAGDGKNRFFVVELPGQIGLVKKGVLQPTPFLDVSSLATCRGGGLLSVAFAPGYADNGRFYVAYNDAGCNLVVARYLVSSDPDVADPSTRQIVLSISPAVPGVLGHSGGQLAFGPDGFLYVSMGDGTSSGDPDDLAQDPSTLLGKILRIDVETGDPATYTIPPTNPYVNAQGYRPEIWALGFRNPYRFSFDQATGDLYIADVGEATWEEVDFQPSGDPGGENYGWRRMEGPDCFGASTCDATGLTMPVAAYDHSQGDCSITGGEVYRGTADPRLAGIYFAGDFCTGRIWGFRQDAAGWQSSVLTTTAFSITGFGHDESGNLYVTDFNDGLIYRLTSRRPRPGPHGRLPVPYAGAVRPGSEADLHAHGNEPAARTGR
jgi:glucose/arabinose dehydrogenase